MNIIVNTTSINNFLALAPNQIFWVFFVNFGWLILAIVFLSGMREVYLLFIRIKWSIDQKTILLAIDIPRGNEQSPKAVENMFSYLSGAHGSINFFEKWFEGKYQKSFSFEIVSLEGYTQFLVESPLEFRNLVESAIYSQYPDAEISEVEDYTKNIPSNVPNEEYDVWGTEFIQSAPPIYPIKCYQEFEHQIGPSEMQFKDPMASLMDLFSSLGPGEYLWFQMLVAPTGFDWIKKSTQEIDRILHREKKAKAGFASWLIESLGSLSELFYSIWGDIDSSSEEHQERSMLDLTPDEKRKVEGIQIKSSKLGLEAKFRVVYIAKREAMNKAKVANGIIGYIKQFSSLDLNGLMPDIKLTLTKTIYFFTKIRLLHKKRKIFNAYLARSDTRGRRAGLYNIEELATIWHFPIEANVKASMIEKAPGRKADAPVSLPIVEDLDDSVADIFQDSSNPARTPDSSASLSSRHDSSTIFDLDDKEKQEEKKPSVDLNNQHTAPPKNLPFV